MLCHIRLIVWFVQRLPLPTQNIRGSGLLWLEVERDGILSTAVPVVVSTDMDVVEELSDLLDDLAMGRWLSIHRLATIDMLGHQLNYLDLGVLAPRLQGVDCRCSGQGHRL